MIRWLVALCLLTLGVPVLADEMRPVAIRFEQVGETAWRLGWRQPIASAADDRMALPQLPGNCRIDGDVKRQMAPLASIGSADVRCAGDISGQTIGWPAFPGHGEAIVRVAPLERPLQVHRLTPETPSAAITAKPSAAQVWRSYFVIGVDHILAGWDHLLFVIALVLLVGRPWPVVKAATAFTIAHSITLAAVTLGFAGIRQDVVEALIALSIVFLAIEIVRGERATLTRRLPWLVAFVFGLLHGFGFAGALREIGLPEGEIPAALISFNLGVEAGQLLVVAVVLALMAAMRRLRPQAGKYVVRLSAYGIGIIGSYWLIDRLVA